MSQTDTRSSLLTTALQDLRAAHDLIVKDLPDIADKVADSELGTLFQALVERSRDASAALIDTGRGKGGEPNIWMKGVLDDARRDAETTERGPLRDVALIGALRKGKASAIVSYETAIALADEDHSLIGIVERLRQHDIDEDHELRANLTRISASG